MGPVVTMAPFAPFATIGDTDSFSVNLGVRYASTAWLSPSVDRFDFVHRFFPFAYLVSASTTTSVSVFPSASARSCAAVFSSVGMRNVEVGVLGLFGTGTIVSPTVQVLGLGKGPLRYPCQVRP